MPYQLVDHDSMMDLKIKIVLLSLLFFFYLQFAKEASSLQYLTPNLPGANLLFDQGATPEEFSTPTHPADHAGPQHAPQQTPRATHSLGGSTQKDRRLQQAETKVRSFLVWPGSQTLHRGVSNFNRIII